MPIRRQKDLLPFLFETWPKGYVRLLQMVSEAADTLSLPLFVVGGVVRDLLLAKSSPDLDLDLMVEGEAGQLAAKLVDRYGGKLIRHPRFHTAKWLLAPEVWQRLGCEQPAGLQSLDLVTARTESYAHPAALPDVTPAKLKDDLGRRDFTINAMALRLNGVEAGQFVDHFSGLMDLENGLIRVLHSESFHDDPTRLFRAARFACRFDFPLVPDTQELFEPGFSHLSGLTGERVKHEFEAIWREEDPAKTMCYLHESGLLTSLHSALCWRNEMAVAQLVLEDKEPLPGIVLWLTHFAKEVRVELAERWYFANHWRELVENVAGLVSTLQDVAVTTLPADAYHLIKVWDRQSEVIPLARARLQQQPQLALLQQYEKSWSSVEPLLNGNDLQQLGIPAGPRYKTILRTLFAAQLNGNLTTRPDAEKLARTLYQNE